MDEMPRLRGAPRSEACAQESASEEQSRPTQQTPALSPVADSAQLLPMQYEAAHDPFAPSPHCDP
jgi:hypothetical protein